MADKIQEFLNGLNDAERFSFIKHLANTGKGNTPEMAKEVNYINKEAAEIAMFAGYGNYPTKYQGKTISQVYKENFGSEIKKAVGDYTGGDEYMQHLTNWTRNDKLLEADAEKYWNMVFNHADSFLQGVTRLTGNKLTYPIDVWFNEEENLISTERLQRQLTASEKRDQVGKVGYELLARHVEMQYDLKELDITNNLYDPMFQEKILTSIMTGMANDLLRLWTNGVSDDYSAADPSVKTDMYKLGVGWTKMLQDSNGSWTNSNKVSIVLGAGGDIHTANKVRINQTGIVTKYAPTFDDVDGFVGVDDATLSVSSNALVVTKGTDGSSAYGRKIGLKVKKNTESILNIKQTGGDATSSAYIEVYNSKGEKLAETSPVVGTAATSQVISFFADTNYVEIRLHQTTDSQAASFSDLTLTQNILETTGEDLIEYMDQLIKNMPLKYKSLLKTSYEFCMSVEDVEKFADAKGAHLTVSRVTGEAVGINNTLRDRWVVEGEVPRHKGIPVTWNPYQDSVDDAITRGGVSKYGMIILQQRKDLYILGVNDVKTTREYQARLSSGGSGIEITKRMYTDAGTAPCERFGVAFKGAKCEKVVLMQDTKIKSTECATGVTTAASGCVPYCDTKDARIFAVLTANVSKVATLALAEANVGSGVYEIAQGDVFDTSGGLTAAAWTFVAFKTQGNVEILDRSTAVACTFA